MSEIPELTDDEKRYLNHPKELYISEYEVCYDNPILRCPVCNHLAAFHHDHCCPGCTLCAWLSAEANYGLPRCEFGRMIG